MPRTKRQLVSQNTGSYHLISRVAGGELLFNQADKECFLKLLERMAKGFFVQVHAFAIMSNHFHILATCMEQEAKNASREELLKRYRLLYPNMPGPPEGTYGSNGELESPDEDGGTQRLRNRLGSISRFMQELKQSFSRWYNKQTGRKGYLWSDRFKGVIIGKGEAQLGCSTYIDLNAIRAKIVKKPEAYRWSSIGLRMQTPKRSKQFLNPLAILPTQGNRKVIKGGHETRSIGPDFSLCILPRSSRDNVSVYHEFVNESADIERVNELGISDQLFQLRQRVKEYYAGIGIGDSFRKRVKNMSSGLVVGSSSFVAQFQEKWKRKKICPRPFMGDDTACDWAFSTRVLRR